MTNPRSATPDYVGLVRFLMQPFLDNPNDLRIDCEFSAARSRVWVRLAFEGADKGRAFGRGGRNVQAVRSVLAGVAKAAGQTANLDIFGGHSQDEGTDDRGRNGADRDSRPRAPRATPKPKPR